MIYYPNQGAGLCNRLLAAAHLIAHVEVTGNSLFHAALRKYAGVFEGIPENGFVIHKASLPRRQSWRRLPVAFLRSGIFPPGEISFSDPRVKRAETARVLVLIGWRFRDAEALHANADAIRDFFRPVTLHREAIADCLEPLKKKCDFLVGIHIRRGDYASFRGGKYFYDDKVYRRIMTEVQAQLNGKAGFLLASDDSVDINRFKDFQVQKAPGNEIQDLYALSGCDLVIGPPSTYSAWASFYGNIPMLHVEHAEQALSLKGISLHLKGSGNIF